MWEGLQGAMSDVFQMPFVKNSAQASKSKDELKTETGGERNRGSPA
jgi:signal peptidase complex subunit 3